MIAKHNSLLGVRLQPIWCMDGDKSPNKKATQDRIDKIEPKLHALMQHYMKAKLLSKPGSESRIRLEKYKTIEVAYYRVEKFFTEETIYIDKTKDTFEENFRQIQTLLPIVKIKPRGFDKTLYEIFDEYPGFKNNVIRIPQISEGEKLCCILTQLGICEGIHANDSDSLIFGGKFIFFKKKSSKNANPKYDNNLPENKSDPWYSLYSYQEVIARIGLSPSEMLVLAVRMGNDFNKRVSGERFDTIVKDIKTKKDFDIYNYNVLNCGRLNPDICVDEFEISKDLKKFIFDKFKEMMKN